jgi:2-amino-4-hydroxy-6-hydroxymethyldihydropteridine diphosphokinase
LVSKRHKHIAFIGVGSNVGDKADNCRKGIEAIDGIEGCTVEIQSPLYETEPIYLEDQDWFVNGVAKIGTDFASQMLFENLKNIEQRMGRQPEGVRFGPRALDLDILFFDDLVLRAGLIEIPHPRLHERRFVLRPLCDVAPELIHPVLGKSIRFLLSQLQDGGKRVTML